MKKEASDKLKEVLYHRCTFDKGTISYWTKLNGNIIGVREHMTIPKHLQFKLKQIESTLSFKWDRLHLCWNVVHKRIGELPYVVTPIKNDDGSYRTVDARELEQVRRSIWWSSVGIARQARMMANEEGYAKARQEIADRERNTDIAKELSPLVVSLGDAKNSSHGKSEFLFAGHGEGKP